MLLAEHLERLSKACLRLKIFNVNLETIKSKVLALANTKQKAIIKIIVTRGTGGRGYSTNNSTPAEQLVLIYDWPSSIMNDVTLRLCQLKLSHQPLLAGIKHLNKLENILARLEWNDPEIHEGLLCDFNLNVIETISSNVFMVKDTILLTPKLDNCGVEGIMRNHVINIAKNNNYTVEIRTITLTEFNNADEIFLTNSINEIQKVSKFEDKRISISPITEHLIALVKNDKYA